MDDQYIGLDDQPDPRALHGLLADSHSQTRSPRLQQTKPSSSMGLVYGLVRVNIFIYHFVYL